MPNYIDYLIDCITLIVFFRQLKFTKEKKYIFIALLFMLPIIPLYITNQFTMGLWLRTLLRIISAFIFLTAAKRTSFKQSVYFSIQFTAYMMAMQSVRPFLGMVFPLNKSLALDILYDIVQIAAALGISFIMPLHKIKKISIPQIIILAFVFILVYYSKNISYIAMPNAAGGSVSQEFSYYTIMILLLSLVLLALYDRMFIAMEESKRQEILALGATFSYNSLRDKLDAQSNVQKIYHDMKNHLLALRSMPDQSESKTNYIDTLLEKIDISRGGIETENAMLNGFLHEKNLKAREKQIQMGISLDVSPLSDMDPVDLCSIIGNAVDNAIEAAEKVQDVSSRFINIRSNIFANQFVLNISNSCESSVLKLNENNLPETTKTDKASHGIGTRSIQDTVKKYNGTLKLAKQGDDVFTLTIMMPIKQSDQ